MKKKFINGLLLVALFLGVTSSMVSCKDYDDDKIGDLKGIIADNQTDLLKALEAQKKELTDEIARLNEALNACKSTCEDFRSKILDKFNEYVLLTEYNQFKVDINGQLANIYTKQEVNDKETAIYASIEELRAKFADYITEEDFKKMLQQKVDELKELINAKASVESIIALINEGNNELTNALTKYFTGNTEIANYITQLIKDNSINEEGVKAIVDKAISEAVLAINSELNGVKATAEEALRIAQTNEGKIAELTGTVNGLTTTVSGLSDAINTLNGAVAGINEHLLTLDTKVQTAQDTADEAVAAAAANLAQINALRDNYNALAQKLKDVDSDISLLFTAINEVIGSVDAIEARLQADEAAAAALHAQMLETISGLVSAIEENATTIGELKEQVADQVAALGEQIAGLQGALNTVNETIATNAATVESMFNNLKNAFAKFITGIELNGTRNPLYGEFALPFGIRSNVLVAFHGQLDDNGIQFPTDQARFYALPDAQEWNNITEEDIAMIGDLKSIPGYVRRGANSDIVALDGAEGNAGTLYLTVNPTDRDFTGTSFSLINSRNEASAVTLSNLCKSDQLLTWGITRADVMNQSANGFYETKATFSIQAVRDYAERLNIDLSGMKNLLRDIEHYEDGISLTNLVNTVYNNLSQVLEAKAVKASWEDEFGPKSVISQYDIAVTTIKPLSFAFAKDLDANTVPGLGRAEDYIDRLIDRVFEALPELNNDKFRIEKIDLDDLTNELIATFHIYLSKRNSDTYKSKTVTLHIPDYTVYDDDGSAHVIHPASPEVTVTLDGQDCEVTVTYDISGEVARYNNYIKENKDKILAQINDYLEDINDLIADLNDITLSSIENTIKEQVDKVIDDINKRFARFMNPNKYMQPVMLVKAQGGYARLSRAHNYPANVTSTNLLLVPTTYNAEMISPAYKKLVAVTNVMKDGVSAKGGDAECKAELDRANAQDRMKQVIDGGFSHFIEFEGKVGYTYEILYSAVDYSGLVSTRKFYVRIGE